MFLSFFNFKIVICINPVCIILPFQIFDFFIFSRFGTWEINLVICTVNDIAPVSHIETWFECRCWNEIIHWDSLFKLKTHVKRYLEELRTFLNIPEVYLNVLEIDKYFYPLLFLNQSWLHSQYFSSFYWGRLYFELVGDKWAKFNYGEALTCASQL